MSAEEKPRYVRLALDGFELAVSQTEVRSVEPVAEIAPSATSGRHIGEVSLAGGIWRIYALGAELSLCDAMGAASRVCVLLSAESFYFGLACTAVTPLDARACERAPVPRCMQTSQGVVEELIVVEQSVVCVTSSIRLARHLQKDERKPQRRTSEVVPS